MQICKRGLIRTDLSEWVRDGESEANGRIIIILPKLDDHKIECDPFIDCRIWDIYMHINFIGEL